MFTAAAQVAAVERRVTAYSEAGPGTDSSQPSFRVSEPCIPVRSGRPSLVQLAETGPASGSEPGAAHRFVQRAQRFVVTTRLLVGLGLSSTFAGPWAS